MGHSEMLLAVAGLDDGRVKALTVKLAKGNLESFSEPERLAFRFAKKLTLKPGSVTDADVRNLVAAHGRHRAIDIIWQVAWSNYMTRVADVLQLPLEPTNVFGR